MLMMYGLHCALLPRVARFTKTTYNHWVFFSIWSILRALQRGIGKRGKRTKRDIVRASEVLFMRSFSHEGVFSDSGRWAAFCWPFPSCMSVDAGLHGPRYIHFLDIVILPCINTLSMNDVARVLRLESSSDSNSIHSKLQPP